MTQNSLIEGKPSQLTWLLAAVDEHVMCGHLGGVGLEPNHIVGQISIQPTQIIPTSYRRTKMYGILKPFCTMYIYILLVDIQ